MKSVKRKGVGGFSMKSIKRKRGVDSVRKV